MSPSQGPEESVSLTGGRLLTHSAGHSRWLPAVIQHINRWVGWQCSKGIVQTYSKHEDASSSREQQLTRD